MIPSYVVLAVIVPLVIGVADALAGMLAAWVQRRWDWRRLSSWLQTTILGQIGGLIILGALAAMAPLGRQSLAGTPLAWLTGVLVALPYVLGLASGQVTASLAADLKDKFTSLGLPVKSIPIVTVQQPDPPAPPPQT